LDPVGQATAETYARLRKKYPSDEWLSTLEKLVAEDETLDEMA